MGNSSGKEKFYPPWSPTFKWIYFRYMVNFFCKVIFNCYIFFSIYLCLWFTYLKVYATCFVKQANRYNLKRSRSIKSSCRGQWCQIVHNKSCDVYLQVAWLSCTTITHVSGASANVCLICAKRLHMYAVDWRWFPYHLKLQKTFRMTSQAGTSTIDVNACVK